MNEQRGEGGRGQTMVELALILPLFLSAGCAAAGQRRTRCQLATGSGRIRRLGKVQVIITATHPFFGRIFGSDTATVTTDAVASNDA